VCIIWLQLVKLGRGKALISLILETYDLINRIPVAPDHPKQIPVPLYLGVGSAQFQYIWMGQMCDYIKQVSCVGTGHWIRRGSRFDVVAL
jgi:hypothetical protein